MDLPGITRDSWHKPMSHRLGKNRNEEARRQRELLFSHWRECSVHLKGNRWLCEHGCFHVNLIQLSAGLKEPSCPSLATSSLLVLTVAQAFHGSRDGDTIPKMYQEKCYDIWEAKAFQPLTVLPFALRHSNGIHLAFPLRATPGSRVHASEKDFGPMLPHIFTSTSTTDS